MLPNDLLILHFRIDTAKAKALNKLKISTVADLLYHLPARYEDINEVHSIASIQKGQEAVIYGVVSNLKTRKAWKSKKPIAEGWVEDGSAKMKVIWFHQPYLAKMLKDGTYVKMSGLVSGSQDKLYLANPEFERLDALPIDRHDSIFKENSDNNETIYPVYRESKGLTSKWIYHAIRKCFAKGVLKDIEDPIPLPTLKRYNLPSLTDAFHFIHTPRKLSDAEVARKRFAFEEIFYIQLRRARDRAISNAASTYTIKINQKELKTFIDRFPFKLTNAQNEAIKTISKDLCGKNAMSRLLEGDVGSGKTAVAATATYMIVSSMAEHSNHSESKKTGKIKMPDKFGNLQTAYMAPTEILAKQHFESFIEYFKHLPISIGLITAGGCYKYPSNIDKTKPTKISRNQLLRWVKDGSIPILIGTHALIYKKISFARLAGVIIDEQHRFGTSQRMSLVRKNELLPHLLSMSATPIPRTLALTLYGDLDLTLLDQMPKGRKPVITKVIGPGQHKEMYEIVRSELDSGRQAYVICPRIEEPDPDIEQTIYMKNVTSEAERLQKTEFSKYKLDILHGKMTPGEKEKIMKNFSEHKIDVLVATSVVEVGVNIPNATVIIIEGAERFGLAQLHQLRGRVLRGEHQAYCFAVTESKSSRTKDRLKALTTAKNGFELAEFDLQFRGSGDLYGQKQSGISDLGMEAMRNLRLVEAAREEARKLVDEDIEFSGYPAIRNKLAKMEKTLHLE